MLAGFLLAQAPFEPLTLEQDYLRTKSGSGMAMVTLIALHEDGTPLRGYISCAGSWFKHQDGEPTFYASSLPFRTDARGAIVMNPSLEDEWIACSATDKGKKGTVVVDFTDAEPLHIVTFVLNKESE